MSDKTVSINGFCYR